MKKIKILSALLALLLLFGVLSGAVWADPETPETEAQTEEAGSLAEESGEAGAEAPTEEEAPRFRDYTALPVAESYDVNCKAALLIERGTNAIIYAKNAEERMYPASLTKITTCMVALEKCAERDKSLDDMVTVTETAYAGLDEASSTAGIQPGDVLSLRDLLYCMMLESANESCNIIAEYLAGDVGTYVGWMNDWVAALGCKETHFVNTHGLHEPDHYTTATDLAVITEAALDNEQFRTIVESASYTVTAEKYNGTRQLNTTNYLLRENFPEYYYARARGVKTGYTSAAGRCLITTASNSAAEGNLNLLAIVLGVSDDENAADGRRYRSFVVARELIEYGFANFESVQVLSSLDLTAQVVVTGGENNSVVLYPAEDVNCLLPKDFEEEKITTAWELDGKANKLEAPISAGQRVGTIRVYYEGVEIGKTGLEALVDVRARTTVENMVAETDSFFKTALPEWLRDHWWVFALAIGLIVLLFAALVARNYFIRKRRREQMLRRRREQQQRQQRP